MNYSTLRRIFALALFAGSTASALSFEAKGSPVFVKFHAPWCGFCKKLAPEWQKLADEFPEHVVSVDCTVDKDVCAKHGVSGFPTLKLYNGGGTSAGTEEYTSLDRDVYALSEWLLARLGTRTPGAAVGAVGAVGAALDEERLREAIAASTSAPVFVKFYAPWCGFSKELAPIWRKLMAIYPGHLREVDCTKHKPLCKAQGIEGYPTLKSWRGGADTPAESFGGKRNMASLASWLRARIGKGEEGVAPAKGPDGGEAAMDFGSKVCVEQKDAFVKFHSPWCGFCKKLVPEWESLRLEFETEPGLVLAEVDCTKILTRPVCKRFGVDGYPTMLLFKPRTDCKGGTISGSGTEYSGADRDASSLSAWLQDRVSAGVSSGAGREEL